MMDRCLCLLPILVLIGSSRSGSLPTQGTTTTTTITTSTIAGLVPEEVGPLTTSTSEPHFTRDAVGHAASSADPGQASFGAFGVRSPRGLLTSALVDNDLMNGGAKLTDQPAEKHRPENLAVEVGRRGDDGPAILTFNNDLSDKVDFVEKDLDASPSSNTGGSKKKVKANNKKAKVSKKVPSEGEEEEASSASSAAEPAKEECRPDSPAAGPCLTEDCIMASATVLASLDRTADPCEDFYQYACGGWMQNSIVPNSDRFNVVDKRNQNLVKKLLLAARSSSDQDEPDSDDDGPQQQQQQQSSAKGKAKTYFKSCMYDSDDESQDRHNLADLAEVIRFAGGWHLGKGAGGRLGVSQSRPLTFDQRVQVMQNHLAVNVLFTWGVVEHEGAYRLAVIAGGWSDALVAADEGGNERSEYLKLMSMYSLLLTQMEEDPVVAAVDDVSDVVPVENDDDHDDGARNNKSEAFFSYFEDSSNSTTYVNVTYDYEELVLDDLAGPGGPLGSGQPHQLLREANNNDSSSAQMDFLKNVMDSISWLFPAADDDDDLNSRHHVELQDQGTFLDSTVGSSDQVLLDTNESTAPLQGGSPGSTPTSTAPATLENNLSVLLQERLHLEAELSKIIDLELKLFNITSKPADTNSLKPMTVRQMAERYPFLDWHQFFAKAFEPVDRAKQGPSPPPGGSPDSEPIVTQDTEVLVQEEYLDGLNSLMVQEYLGAPEGSEALVNYMIWKLVSAFYPDRPSDESQRVERCLKETEEFFAPAITALYVEAKGLAKSLEVVQAVDEMVDVMKLAFRENLPKLEWMTERSRKAAEVKLQRMSDLIGFPAHVTNDTWLDEIFSDFTLDSKGTYLLNLVSGRAFARSAELRQYLTPSFGNGSGSTWNDFSHMANIATVNAYYNQVTNTMIVPIGMLQPPLFWNKPKSLTFGAFGIIVAHEITHAFDEVGIMYDADGMYKPLYDNETVARFEEASDCIRRQYSSFSLGDMQVDGNATLSENIADHGGLEIAEIAYEKWLAKSSGGDSSPSRSAGDIRLPSLESFTDRQLFYLGYALPWCAVHTESLLRNHVMKDEHAPDRFRVIGPLSNSERFSEAWGCKSGGQSAMNPENKCKVW